MKITRILRVVLVSTGIVLFHGGLLQAEIDVPLSTMKASPKASRLIIQAAPPMGHHFNLDAPTKLVEGEKSYIPKSVKEKEVVFSVPHKGTAKVQRSFMANLFVCDEAERYCVPQRVSFTWDPIRDRVEARKNSDSATLAKPVGKKTTKEETHDEFGFILDEAEKAFAQAKKENKPVLIDFYTIWCPPCNALDEETYSSDEFRAIALKFVLLKIDADKKSSWTWKKRFDIKGYPTLVFTTSAGEEISRFTDFRTPAEFTRLMRTAYVNRDKAGPSRKEFVQELEKLPKGDSRREQLWDIRYDEARANKADDLAKITILENALAEFPETPDALYRNWNLASLYKERGRKKHAKRQYRRIRKLSRKFLHRLEEAESAGLMRDQIWSSIGSAERKLGNKRAAKRAYKKAVEALRGRIAALEAGNPARGYHLTLAYLLRQIDKEQEAFEIYASFQKRYPKEYTFYYAEAWARYDNKELNLAEKKAEQAYEFSYGDNRLRAVKVLAKIRVDQGKKADALSLIRMTLETVPLPDSEVSSSYLVEDLKELEKKLSS